MFKNKKNKKIISIIISIIMSLALTINCYAIEFVGTSGSGGQKTSNTSGQYSISDDSKTGGICGYRFTLVDDTGENLTKSVDMLCTNYKYASYATGATRFATKLPKTYWIEYIDENIVFGNNATESNTNVCHDTDVGLNLSTDADTVEAQMTSPAVLDIILRNIGSSWLSSNLPAGSKVLCEPLFILTIKGVKYTMTITEIGKYGRSQFGENEGTSSTGNQNSWGYISDYTNKYWPGRLHISEAYCNWASGANNNSTRKTFGDLIRRGYGVCFAYNNEEEPPQTTPVVVKAGTADGATSIKIFKDAARTIELSEDEELREGVEYYPRYYFYNSAEEEVECWLWCGYEVESNESVFFDCLKKSFRGETFYDGEAFSIDALSDKYPKDYTYSLSSIKFSSTIELNDRVKRPNGLRYEDNTFDDNETEIAKYYTIINPSIKQYFCDNGGYDSDSMPGYGLIQNAIEDKKIYSGENIKAYTTYTNESSFNADFIANSYLDDEHINRQLSYIEAKGEWSTRPYYFRAKNINSNPILKSFESMIYERSGFVSESSKETIYTIYPTDLEAVNIEYVDYETGEVVTKVKQNQKIMVKYTFKNNTDTPVAVKMKGYVDNTVYDLAGIILGTDKITEKDIVIDKNSYVSINSEPFFVNGIGYSKINAKAEIYLYDMWEDTSYEINGANNVISFDDEIGNIEIDSPFISELYNKNSDYRRNKTVVTSFKILNNSNNLDVGDMNQINKGLELLSTFKVYTDEACTNEIVSLSEAFVIAKNSETLVWFKWDIPSDAPDKLYAVFVADTGNFFSNNEFNNLSLIDNCDSKNIKLEFDIFNETLSVTPDTTYSEYMAYWYNGSGNKNRYSSIYANSSDFISSTSWSYYVNQYDEENDEYKIVLKTEYANINDSYVTIVNFLKK